ncbi:MAG: dephospho-CoA kinase [Betaproteobacteria bacterium]|nr:dephospho-CoA kinase [Betaproteobacteria bacterium]
MVVGLTGGIGSGKTTVANLFGELGVALVDTDLIAHQLTGPGGMAMPAIQAAFGPSVIAADGRLDRAAMRQLAFSDPAARRRLEAILHPLIRQESERQLGEATSPYAILVVPLLVEGGRPRERAQRVLVVDCQPQTQVERVMKRNNLPREQVEAILAAQASREQRLAAADDLIDNDGAPDTLPQRVRALHERYLALIA